MISFTRAASLTIGLLISSLGHAEIYLHAGHLLDVETGKILSAHTIVIEGDTISAVKPGYLTGDDVKIIDLRNHWVLPGVMDMHTHLVENFSGDFYAPLFESPHRAVIGGVVNAKKTLLAGFTTVRDVGSSDYQDVAVRNAINAGDIPGPRMFVAGPALGITGGHCDENSLNHAFNQRADGVADGPWAARAQVRKNVKYQVDLIKFCATGGVFSKGTQVGQRQYTLEEMQAIVDEAHTHGRPVAAHAHGTEGIAYAIQAGVDSVEHVSFLDKKTAKLAKKHGTFLSMDIYNTEYTLSMGEANGVPQENIDKERQVGTRQRESFALAVNTGARVVFGSDAGVYPHGDNAKQFSRMVQFGMTPLQAIQAATLHSAALLRQQNRLGQIKPTYAADIIAVSANPLDDVSVLERVNFVMKAGAVYKRPK
ncbi:metal-dependent hydrolase family protein [Simiduia aestuariiviva]|uniref:Imidazolonepropionase-like amidohydrolase n=1 Tax=Simiduia aestuariiviva TaxID=1510459 RepID=A0A839UGR5_9GAMM|nr:amidohydrolase family protein [Simiduia aestuariiviva]MBB3167072.1 imidazolonepropionase-like amidohydrolase [Simiduia aestuariiviva]